MRLVRTLFEGKIGLGEAKELVERAPVVLWDQSLSRAEAKEKVEALLAVGASAERF